MTAAEFKTIRRHLGFSQAGLAEYLDYGSSTRISEFERKKAPRPVPYLLALLMTAYADGYRPSDWPLPTNSSPD